MASSLIKLQETIANNDVSVILGNTYWDTSYDVYVLKLSNLKPAVDNGLARMRILSSGSVVSTANYLKADKGLRSDSAFNNNVINNGTYWEFDRAGNAGGENFNGTFFLYNFNNASEYNFTTFELTQSSPFDLVYGCTGGGCHKVAQTANGIEFWFSSGNIASGVLTLYGLRK